ncbi:Rv2231c family pyridoxal phosphate-dependent protein CobC [Fodinicola acaciae]|uniref:Rv2231c family pyridoxal phosphate-dependent protein CobC n=1 Tax=Fodinicola acaciae TaxID=2681555 RepID=UPI0013D3577A|nr:Rv2231c family pyridoxal phosphate-dependent protein CobC [Fodinicola acaciae]
MSALVVGVGCRSGATADDILALLSNTLAEAGLSIGAVSQLSTVDVKATEPAVVEAARRLGVPVVACPATTLASIEVSQMSDAAACAVGTGSVAEAAVLAAGAEIVVQREKSAVATVSVGRLTFDLSHHGDADAEPGLVDLAVNVRAGAPPGWLRDQLTQALREISAYPDVTTARLAVARRHSRDPAEVLLTAGAAEAFVLLARTTRARRIVVVHPQFTEPEAAMRAAGHRVERVVLPAESGFFLDPALVPTDADLVLVGNPTNPTSVLHPAATLRQLARPGRMLVVDEAFADTIAGEPESLSADADVPGLVVLRSLTKTWGLAGLRVGYLLAERSVVSTVERAQPLWSVSSLAAVAAEACSTPVAVAEAAAAAEVLARHRGYLVSRLRALGIDLPVEPASSFVLLRLADGPGVRDRLRKRGFAVRRGDTFPGLGPDWLRIAVRDPATTDAFVGVLAEVL